MSNATGKMTSPLNRHLFEVIWRNCQGNCL